MLNYIDDLLYFDLPSSIDSTYNFLVHLPEALGLNIITKQLHLPHTVLTCLGIQFHPVRRTLSIPSEKLQDYTNLLKNYRLVSNLSFISKLSNFFYYFFFALLVCYFAFNDTYRLILGSSL